MKGLCGLSEVEFFVCENYGVNGDQEEVLKFDKQCGVKFVITMYEVIELAT